MADRRFPIALAMSLVIHTLVAGVPGWQPPSARDVAESTVLLDARLAPATLPASAAVPVPPPRKPGPARPAPELREAREAVPPVEPAARPAPLEAAPAAATPSPPAAPAATAAEPPAPAEIPLPRRGRIRFKVALGEGELGSPLGESVHTWRHDGSDYSLHTQTETTGLVALFRSVRIIQVSEGGVGPAGLQPREFHVERNGQPAEGARFDWSGMRVALRTAAGVRELAMAAGAQDLLSQMYQIGMMGVAPRIELMVATGKTYGRYAFETVGEELLATRFGDLRTWHVRTPALPGEQAMELWLALDYRNLPVRIRYRDRKGDVFEQNAVEFEVDGARLAEKAE